MNFGLLTRGGATQRPLVWELFLGELAKLNPVDVKGNADCREHVIRDILERDVRWWVTGRGTGKGVLRPEVSKRGHDVHDAINFMKYGTYIRGIGDIGGYAYDCFCENSRVKKGLDLEWP